MVRNLLVYASYSRLMAGNNKAGVLMDISMYYLTFNMDFTCCMVSFCRRR